MSSSVTWQLCHPLWSSSAVPKAGVHLEFPSSALGHSACLHTNTSQASPSQVPCTSVNSLFSPPSCRSRELMDALERAALPVFSTTTTEDQHLLPEKERPICSPRSLQRANLKPPLQSGGPQPCPFSWEVTKDRLKAGNDLPAC